MDTDIHLMYGYCVAYTLHKPIARASTVSGDEFCHGITKFYMFCPFSLCNKSVIWFDQAFILIYLQIYSENEMIYF